jgi:uncharacterized protein YecE (DUF72 family)
MQPGNHHIGTSGWSYTHWSRGRFYPNELKSGQWFEYYARHFDTVEINLSFYRIPKADMVERWVEVAPGGFLFALKLWRGITHLKRLAGTLDYLRNFMDIAERLGDKRGPLLVQLPPQFKCDPDRLDGFLTDLSEAMTLSWRVAVEFRNPDWLRPEVYALLDRRDVALCLADMVKCPITEPNAASFVYVRRHGGRAHPEGRYTDEQVAEDAGRVQEWLREGRDVFVYYNNDLGGHAVDNALLLERLLKSEAE